MCCCRFSSALGESAGPDYGVSQRLYASRRTQEFNSHPPSQRLCASPSLASAVPYVRTSCGHAVIAICNPLLSCSLGLPSCQMLICAVTPSSSVCILQSGCITAQSKRRWSPGTGRGRREVCVLTSGYLVSRLELGIPRLRPAGRKTLPMASSPRNVPPCFPGRIWHGKCSLVLG